MGKTERSRVMLLAVLLVVLVAAVAWQLRNSSALGGGGKGSESMTYSPHQVPALDMASLTPVPRRRAEASNNPFVFRTAPTPTPNLTPRPTLPPRPTMPVRRLATPTPRMIKGPHGMLPPPPHFNRVYIGYFGPKKRPVAVFRKGTEVEVALTGGVIDDTFIVRDVGYDDVQIGYVGYPEEVTTRVPLEK
jgi:hypothetical protein